MVGVREGPLGFGPKGKRAMGNGNETTVVTEPRPERLHVWYDGNNWVIAHTEEHATALLTAMSGPQDEEPAWKSLPDDEVLAVVDDERGLVEQPCSAWVTEQGAGVIASLDY